MATRRRIAWLIVVGGCLLVVVVFLAPPVFFTPDRYRPVCRIDSGPLIKHLTRRQFCTAMC